MSPRVLVRLQNVKCACCYARGRVAALAVLALLSGMSLRAYAALEGTPLEDAQNIVHMLDYVGVDYPVFVQDGRILDEAEYAEQLEFAGQVEALLGTLPDHPEQAALIKAAGALKADVLAHAPGTEITRQATTLRWAVIKAYDLAVTPKRAPDLGEGAALYATHCASCHGMQGRGDGPAAAGLEPAPANFHDAGRMAQRSLYGLYSTITLGVQGTGMAGYRALSEDDRWALAFYAGGLGLDSAEQEQGARLWEQGVGRPVFSDLKPLTTLTRQDVVEQEGPEAAMVMAWLVGHPAAIAVGGDSPIALSKRLLEDSVQAYLKGDREAAQRLAVSAYLEGFELAEASLDAVDGALRLQVEEAMLTYRSQLRAAAPEAEVGQQATRIQALLDQSAERLGDESLSPVAVAGSAFVILLREGLEAILVLAAVIAFLVKAERRDVLKYVHAGWIGALLLGVATWFLARYVVTISGAGRELTEGITALLAAAILLYVGFWLHDKSHAKAWKGFIEKRLKGALSQGTLWALVAVSFFAVYREVFETVLFYQALWSQAGSGSGGYIVTGLLLGAITLMALSWAIFHYGVRLPIGAFFTASSILLALLAVVFVGHGVAALQEADWLPANLIAFPRVPVLGIYPTVQSLAAQAVMLLIILIGFAYGQRATGGGKGSAPVGA